MKTILAAALILTGSVLSAHAVSQQAPVREGIEWFPDWMYVPEDGETKYCCCKINGVVQCAHTYGYNSCQEISGRELVDRNGNVIGGMSACFAPF